MSATTVRFLTTYDPPGTSEDTLDQLGPYQIADQLPFQLVPTVGERVQGFAFSRRWLLARW